MTRFSLFLPIALLAACNPFDPTICTTEAIAGISLTVTDAESGLPIASGVRAAAHEGAFVDSLTGRFNSGAYTGVFERSGIYTVEVVHPDYQPWSRDGVWVRGGECHVSTVGLRAELVPSS